MTRIIKENLGNIVSKNMFGANYLVQHDLNPQNLDGNSFSVENFVRANAALGGVEGWRYPGGSVTEEMFDIFSPESSVSKDGTQEILPLSGFFDLVGAGASVSIVVPTVDALQQGVHGQRQVDQNYVNEVKKFVRETLEKAEQKNVSVDSFEIGNEFWGSGRMSEAEYGRVAGTFSVAIQEEIGDSADIIVQSLHSINEYCTFSKGQARDALQALITEFSNINGAVEATDAIVDHFYPANFGVDDGSKSFFFDQLETFEEETGKNYDWHVTEWNYDNSSTTEDLRGLKQASLLVETMYRLVDEGVDVAKVWPVWFSNKVSTALVHAATGTSGNFSVKHGGAAFAMMNDTIADMRVAGHGDILDNGVNDVEYHAFSDGNAKDVIFFSNQTGDAHSVVADLSDFVGSYGSYYFVTATKLEDNVPSTATWEQMARSAVSYSYLSSSDLSLQDMEVAFDLSDWELLRLEITDITNSGDEIFGRGADDLIEGLAGQDTLWGGDGDDTIDGGNDADVLHGGTGFNLLLGGGGNDWINIEEISGSVDGGSGVDTVSFAPLSVPPTSGYRISADLEVGEVVSSTGSIMSVVTIENLTGSVFADYIRGNNGRSESFRGLGEYDWFIGSGGADSYDGGSGKDTVAYSSSSAAVSASLAAGSGSAGDALGDTYVFVENLTGTNFDDILVGDGNRNKLRGMYGDDHLQGGGGIDYLEGGKRNDTLDGGSGSDYAIFVQGERDDYTIQKTGSRSAIVSGLEGTDTLLNIEYLQFSDQTIAIWDL